MGCFLCEKCGQPIDKGDDCEYEDKYYHDTCLMEAGLEELERIEE